MNYSKLAKITPERLIARNERSVHILWDGHNFELSRAEFVRTLRTLERGLEESFAEDDVCSVVHVDNQQVELWIENVCLRLTWREYAKLINAMLTSETRLHGVKFEGENHAKPQKRTVDIRPVMTIRPPKPPLNYKN